MPAPRQIRDEHLQLSRLACIRRDRSAFSIQPINREIRNTMYPTHVPQSAVYANLRTLKDRSLRDHQKLPYDYLSTYAVHMTVCQPSELFQLCSF